MKKAEEWDEVIKALKDSKQVLGRKCFFFNDTATTEIDTEKFVGSVRCV